MNSTDIEFTVGLNTSPAEKLLKNLLNNANKADNKLNYLNNFNIKDIYSSNKNRNKYLRQRQDNINTAMENASLARDAVLKEVNKRLYNKSVQEGVLGKFARKSFGDIQTRALDKEVLRIKTNQNKIAAQGALEQYKKLTTPSNVLALPAPKALVDDTFLNEYANKLNGNGGRNEFEERNLQKLLLQSQRRKASFDFSQAESDEERNDAVKRYTDADQALKALNEKQKKQKKESKETVQEEKALNREHDAGIIKLFKITSILYGIKKLIQGIGKLWKFEVDTNLATTARDVKEKGFFSVDARNALRSNTNKERASIARGLQYMGEAAPFQMGDFDSAVKALQDLRLKAMSGQGIADDQRVISLDRLTRLLGLNWNVGKMLSDPNQDLTGMLVDLSDAVERYLPKLDKLKDIDKNLAINDMLNLLGDKLMNAITYHANYNARTGGTETMMEETKRTGSTANLPIDYTKAGKTFADAFAKSVASSDLLKTAFSAWIEKPALGILGFVKEKKDRATQWFNLQNLVNNGFTGPGTLLVASDYHYLKRDKDEEKLNKKWALAHKNEIDASIENYLQHPESATDEDVLRFLNFGDPSLESGVFGHGVEALGNLGLASKYANANAPSFDAMINNPKKFGLSDKDVSIVKKVKEKYPSLNKLGGLDDWQDALGKMQKEIWGEGKIGDYSPEKGQKITDYLRALWGDDYYYGFLRDLYTGSNSILRAGGIYTGASEMNVDGKIIIELKRSDLTGDVEVHTLPATVTVNNLKQAVDMVVTN